MKIHKFVFNLFKENTYIVEGQDKRCAIIDPGFADKVEEERFFSFVSNNSLVPEAILLTHGHFDHIEGVKAVQDRFSIPVYLSAEDDNLPEYTDCLVERLKMQIPDTGFERNDIKDGDIISVAGFDFAVIATPGHTMGSVCYHCRKDGVLFTGDTLFRGSIGRTDARYSDYDKEIVSIMEKIILLEGSTQVFPGHGDSTTIARERCDNPFLEPFNEPEEELDPDAPGVIIKA